MLKEEVLFLSLNEDSETITAANIISSPGGAEVSYFFNGEGAAICPRDGSRLHIAGGIEGGIDLHIDFFFIHDGHLWELA